MYKLGESMVWESVLAERAWSGKAYKLGKDMVWENV